MCSPRPVQRRRAGTRVGCEPPANSALLNWTICRCSARTASLITTQNSNETRRLGWHYALALKHVPNTPQRGIVLLSGRRRFFLRVNELANLRPLPVEIFHVLLTKLLIDLELFLPSIFC